MACAALGKSCIFRVMHWATPQQRRTLGQARRKQVGRQQHNELKPKARQTSALELLASSMHGRLPALIKLKYQLMAASPFGYFRGAVPVMAADLAVLPNTGLVSQLCGDAHVRNLGAFAAPDGRLVFDINDFDETIRGPFEWDLKRMAASLVLAGRASGHKESASRETVEKFAARYCAQMRAFAQMSILEVGHYQVHRLGLAAPVHNALLQAERATPQHTLEQLTEPASDGEAANELSLKSKKRQGTTSVVPQTQQKNRRALAPEESSLPERRFKQIKPTLTRVTGAQAAAVLASLGPYRHMLEPQRQHLLSLYRPVDVAFKVVGTGSVGLRDYCIYFEGNGPADPLFLQIKEEPLSAYAPYLPDAAPPHHNGQRVAEGQKAMQLQSDPFLGWTHFGGRDYLVRQLNDHKGSIELEDLAGTGLEAYAEVCGELLARGHARSGDPLILNGYLGSGDGFAEALAKFGAAYADQTEKDWEELKRSGKAGSKE
jgi:uncharacterized protein (DUF2252 family)